ncbi:MAG: cyclic GMP-AMP synthase DncV-like nucleotidyltransferase [Flavobacteriales bacterium]
MANCDNLFRVFNSDLQIEKGKLASLKTSNDFAREKIRKYFKDEHPDYTPFFRRQGSSVTKNRIRTKDNTCDQDDGVYFKKNPDNVTGTTLQKWVKEALDGITEASPSHRKKCVTLEYKAEYSIDFPVFVFDEQSDEHPMLAIKDGDFREDDPKEFIDEFKRVKDKEGQLIRITRYLKAWCDHKREKMPSGIAMTVLAMRHLQKNDRDDVALKFTLIEIERVLKLNFQCVMPTTPKDDLFGDYDETRRENFMSNLASFKADAKTAVDEENNQLKASRLWQKHLGKTYFPDGKDEDQDTSGREAMKSVIGTSKPYFEK